MHAVDFSTPVVDTQQDVRLVSASTTQNCTDIVLERPFQTCDPSDLPVLEGVPQILIWSQSPSSDLSYHSGSRGHMTAVLRPLPPCPSSADATALEFHNCSLVLQRQLLLGDPAAGIMRVNVTLDQAPTGPGDANGTKYVCKYVRLPSDRKYHITGFTGIVGSQRLHHVVLFRCPSEGPSGGVSAARAAGEAFECTNESITCTVSSQHDQEPQNEQDSCQACAIAIGMLTSSKPTHSMP